MGADAPKGAKISSVILFFQGTLYLCVMFIPLFLTVPVLTSDAFTSDEKVLYAIGMSMVLCFLVGLAAFYYIAGYGLLKLNAGMRKLAIVLGIISLFNIPIGTILGGVVLYYLLKDEETVQAFAE